MEVKQIFQLVNTTTQEVLGESAVVKEDLSNIVDIGTSIFNANAIDKYVKNSMEEAKDALAEKMRQSLQEARDEGMTVSTAQRGDAVAEDDFDFETK